MKKQLTTIMTVLFSAGLLWSHSAAFAVEETVSMADIFVTATRTEQGLDKIGGSSVSVLTFEEIDAKKQIPLSDVLKGIPGIDINRNGGLGTVTSVFLRGADSKNTLILVDGTAFNDPSDPTRGANIENITTDAIERIEVVRGPMSVLYGSNATSGVINIITKKGSGKPSFFAGVEGGSYNTMKYNAGLFGTVDQFNYSLIGALMDTRGFSTANKDNKDIAHDGNTSEKDGWENQSLYGNFSYAWNPDFTISTNFMLLNASLDLDDWGPGYAGDRFLWWVIPEPDGAKKYRQEKDQAMGKISVNNHFFDRKLESRLSFQNSRHKTVLFDNDGDKDGKNVGEIQEWSWQGGIDLLDRHMLDFGLNYFNEKITQLDDYTDISNATADTKSIWAQDQLLFNDALVVVAGVRYDEHEKFGGQGTYRVAPAYYLNNTTVRASYGTGFRAPSLYELFSDSGNEDLQPEKSIGWDVGVDQVFFNDRAKAGVTYYSTIFDDRIGWDFNLITPKTPWGAYNQLDGKTKTKGVEVFVSYAPITDLKFSVDYTYTDTRDPDGNSLVRRPFNKVHGNVRYRLLEKALINLDTYWVGERDEITSAADKDGNPVKGLDAYCLVNLAGHYDITKYIQIHARMDNLLDEFYETAWSYATPGRSGYVGMKLTY